MGFREHLVVILFSGPGRSSLASGCSHSASPRSGLTDLTDAQPGPGGVVWPGLWLRLGSLWIGGERTRDGVGL